ncbi:hypothetical protein VDGD_21550 [Verticillium dahliae]|nr:hypothetical protein VDGD_21550 [Verticillium dahliae]
MTVPLADHPIETPPRAPSPVHNFGTLAVHAGSPHDPTTGAVIESISLSTTFAQTAVGKPVGEYEYSRSSNPNRHNFETARYHRRCPPVAGRRLARHLRLGRLRRHPPLLHPGRQGPRRQGHFHARD